MGSIISSGIGSGIDIDSLVTRLVDAEGAPRKLRLDRTEAVAQGRISAFGTVRSALATLRTSLASLKDLGLMQARSATLSSPDYFTVTTTSSAAAGAYDIEVVQLVSAHKLQSGPFAGGRDTVVGTGTLAITVNGGTANVAIDSAHQTLAGIRDAINADANNPGVTATIVAANDGARLILTSNTAGADYAIRVTSADAALQGLVYDPGVTENLTQVRAAADARILVDGNAVDSATNVFADAIDGVTLTVSKANEPGVTTALTVALDRSATAKTIGEFVKAYNALLTSTKGLSAYNADTKKGGLLLGDSTVRDIGISLRREMGGVTAAAPAAVQQLARIGISFAVDGTLTVDATRLESTLAGDFAGVAQLFAGTDGLGQRLDALLGQYLDTGGLLDARTKGLEQSIKDVASQRTVLQERLAQVEARLRRQFNGMDTLVAQLRNTGDFLTQQLTALTKSTRN